MSDIRHFIGFEYPNTFEEEKINKISYFFFLLCKKREREPRYNFFASLFLVRLLSFLQKENLGREWEREGRECLKEKEREKKRERKRESES